jgi:hypothetical protein
VGNVALASFHKRKSLRAAWLSDVWRYSDQL